MPFAEKISLRARKDVSSQSGDDVHATQIQHSPAMIAAVLDVLV